MRFTKRKIEEPLPQKTCSKALVVSIGQVRFRGPVKEMQTKAQQGVYYTIIWGLYDYNMYWDTRTFNYFEAFIQIQKFCKTIVILLLY